jgi:putative exosortase-associated protein (TIGR04073 family)
MKKGVGKTMKKYVVSIMAIGIVFAVVLNVAAPCFAQGDVIEKMGKKLGRGIVNIATGWVEIPKNIYDTTIETNPFLGITFGTIKGAGMTVVRTGAGAYDVATFLFPLPKDYLPILKPEFVFSK